MARLMPLRCRECGHLTVAPWHKAVLLALLMLAVLAMMIYLLTQVA
jgi:hypothetical protein